MAAEERKERKTLTLEEEPVSKDASQTQSQKKSVGLLSTDEPSTLIAASNDSSEEEPDSSQVPLSQTDEHILRLEKEGQLTQVVGSQSMLSQELMYSSQREDEEVEGLSEIHVSQQRESSISMAKRLGLLMQEEEKQPTQDKFSSPNQASGMTSTPVKSSLLTHVTNNETPSTFAESGSPGQQRSFMPDKDMNSLISSPAAAAFRIPDTPIRESECFGSLLDAVQRITEQEEVNAKIYALQNRPAELLTGVSSVDPGATGDTQSSPNSTMEPTKRKSPSSNEGSPTKKSRKSAATKKREFEQKKAQETAKRAAALAERTVADPEMAKKLLLSMALVRENPRTLPATWPPRGSVVPEGFFWAHYPPLEGVLKKHMAKYYELSTTKCQSAQQQAFNNELVILVRDVALEQGWKFDKCFFDKCLRDRIRCYYKTHIQNAKKRLRTMVRNPTKRANARHLCAHLDLIEQHGATSSPAHERVERDELEGPATTLTRIKKEPSRKATSRLATPTQVKKESTPKSKVVAKPSSTNRRSRTAALKLPVVEV